MRVLREGVSGDDVLAWQRFLRSIDPLSSLDETGTFDRFTRDATAKFQMRSGFVGRDVDGVVGRKTSLVAEGLGFAPPGTSTIVWPKRPGEGPLTPNERTMIFGSFTCKPAAMVTNPEAIIITDDWPSKNVKSIVVPQLKGVKGTSSGLVTMNVKVVPQFLRFFEAIEREGLLSHVLTWDGGWVPRYVRGSKTSLSNHSWGTAFDINARWNPYGQVPAVPGSTGSTCELVSIAHDHGFFWGGHFQARPDGMHFECFKLV